MPVIQRALAGIVGILLAAGSGTRFGGDKLLARMRQWGSSRRMPIGVVALRHLRLALTDVVAVVRSDDHALASALGANGARIVRCASADDGMGASLACAIRATPDAGGWIVALADMPWIAPATIVARRGSDRGRRIRRGAVSSRRSRPSGRIRPGVSRVARGADRRRRREERGGRASRPDRADRCRGRRHPARHRHAATICDAERFADLAFRLPHVGLPADDPVLELPASATSCAARAPRAAAR